MAQKGLFIFLVASPKVAKASTVMIVSCRCCRLFRFANFANVNDPLSGLFLCVYCNLCENSTRVVSCQLKFVDATSQDTKQTFFQKICYVIQIIRLLHLKVHLHVRFRGAFSHFVSSNWHLNRTLEACTIDTLRIPL
jgi:hypothetical protein